MSSIFTDAPVFEICINPDSYGEICVQCGCYDKNHNYRVRIIKQIRIYKEFLHEKYLFDDWSEDEQMATIQKRNVENDILYFKRKIRILRKVLRNIGR